MPLSSGSIVDDLQEQPVIDVVEFFVNQGRAFTFSDRRESIGNNDSIYFYLENPSDSGFDYDVILIPRAGGQVDIDISFDATRNDGNTVTVNNLKSGSQRTFSGIAEESATGDAGTRPAHGITFIEDFAPGGTQGVKVGSTGVNSIAYTIDEGDNKLVELINRSGGSTERIAINMIVLEVDGTYKLREGQGRL